MVTDYQHTWSRMSGQARGLWGWWTRCARGRSSGRRSRWRSPRRRSRSGKGAPFAAADCAYWSSGWTGRKMTIPGITIFTKGLPYMTSAKFSDFFIPPPLFLSQISWFCFFVCFLGTPLPPPTADVIYGSPLNKHVMMMSNWSDNLQYYE